MKRQPRDFLTNMHVEMPLWRKLRLAARNTWIKVSTGSTCCGHPGEPGC